MLSHDHDAISPWYSPSLPADKTVVDNLGNRWVNRVGWRNYADPSQDPPKPANGGALESSTNFTLQLYATVLGMFRFQGNFDNEFVERGRLWKEGKSTAWEVDPLNSPEITGEAKFVDPETGSTYVGLAYADGRGIAQRMITRANQLKAKSTSPISAAALQEYKDLLDVMVQVTTIYDTLGSNWKSNPYDP
jgi:hypothetical protein